MEPPRTADTGGPTSPTERIDVTPPHRLDGTGQHRGPATADRGATRLHRARLWLTGPRRSRRRAVLLGVAVLVVAGVVLAVVDPFTTSTAPTTSKSYSTYAIKRQNLSSQTQVTATLGYSGTYTVTVPSGTSSQSLMQAQQAVAGAQAQVKRDQSGATAAGDAATVAGDTQSLSSARSTLQSDEATLSGDQSTLAAAQEKETNDCAGTGSTSQTCSGDEQKVSSDQLQVSSDEQKVAQDRTSVTQAQSKLSQDRAKQSQDASAAKSTLASDEQTLADDQAALAAAQEEATIQGGAFSKLPAAGQVVNEGQTLYTVGTTPVVLLYGTTPATRNLYEGEIGPDVAELNTDLRALGYTSAPSGDTFTSGTAEGVDAFQARIGVPQTGNLALGQVVFLPTAARITAVSGVLGAGAQPGSAVLAASSTTRQVSITLDANLQSDVKVGDPVTITLPNQSTTPGVVSYIGTVATVPSNSGNNTRSSTPTIAVDVTPTSPSSIGAFDQAPVSVSITNASVNNVLVVPVNALLALEGGGYALEVVPPHGPHYLVPVQTGLFDDNAGLVQVTGSQIQEGMRVVVPST